MAKDEQKNREHSSNPSGVNHTKESRERGKQILQELIGELK